MRHAEVRGLAKDRQELDDDYAGVYGRSVDDSYNAPYSPNSSSEYMNESARSQQHSLFSFVAPKKTQGKKNKNKDNNNQTTKVVEEESIVYEEKLVPQRGRISSREYSDIQFDMETDDDARRVSVNEGERKHDVILTCDGAI